MSVPDTPLPPAIEEAFQLLAIHGPTTPAGLSSLLRSRGFRQSAERLSRLPERFPDRFIVTSDGLLSLAEAPAVETEAHDHRDDASSEDDWYRPSALPRVRPDRVAVLDIETTGLDPAMDFIWEIAVVRLDGSLVTHLVVQVPDGVESPNPSISSGVDVREALRAVELSLQSFDLLIGHNIVGFDVPFLKSVAARCGLAELRLPAVADSLQLSLLADVTMPNRSLADLCQRYSLDVGEAHRAVDDALATAAAVRAMLLAVDVEDPVWQLVIGVLDKSDDPLACLFPRLSRSPELQALKRPEDPLVRASGEQFPDAWTSAREGLVALERREGYRRRQSQREMALAVAAAFDRGGRLAVEAPTGTGKSLAYLLPAIGRASAARRPVVIATATKALQSQLRTDATRLLEEGILRVPYREIQGVANYVCARELEDAVKDEDSSGLALAAAVRALAVSPNGTWDDVTDDSLRRRDARYARTRARLRTTAAGCDRRHCGWAHVCPLMQRLHELDRQPGIVAVNHALLASWVRLRRDGFTSPGDVMAAGNADVVFDEAHALEDTLTGAWTERLDALELEIVVKALNRRSRLMRQVRQSSHQSDATLEVLNLVHERTVGAAAAAPTLAAAITTYLHEYAGQSDAAVLHAGIVPQRPEFRALRHASASLGHALIQLVRAVRSLWDLLATSEGTGSLRRRLRSYGDRIDTAIELLGSLRELPEPHLWVHRLAVEPDDPTAWTYERIPIHVFPEFQDELVDRTHSTVLCSATLTVEQRFDYVASRLGIQIRPDPEPDSPAFRGLRLASPFDYASQSLVVLTNHLPVPVPANEREFCDDMAADQVGFLSLSGGRTLTLFAARKRMELVAAGVRERADELKERGVDLLVQGELGRSQILHRFRTEPGTVLYGLRTYWEGFDAPGETLSYLFIEKPPFPHPDDPLVSARQRAIAERGGDPFVEYVLPLTAMQFTQGFGRLIRSETDRGAALVCDRRLHAPGISRRVIIGSLPAPSMHEALDRDDAWTRAIEFVTGSAPNLADAITLPLDNVTVELERLRLVPGEDPTAKLIEAARLLFGIEELRDIQLEVMRSLVAGLDVLAVLPTGFGKSLCFQLPALLAPAARPTVVVSPLVALIKDQVNDLRGRRGIRSVQGITGTTTKAVQTEILRDTAVGRVRLLYVSPERLARDPVLRGALARQELNAVVVDEAHCISVWGHDFRPEFRQVPTAVSMFALRTPRAGFTATATTEVQADITSSLEMTDPVVVRMPVDRPNLRFRVLECVTERARARELLRIVTWAADRPGLVYVSRRAVAEEIASLLRRAGHTARHYHAGMIPEQRDAIQEDFDADTTRIIVATKAFGMGINKPNIGWVVHYDLPDSLDGYAQEAGRVARSPELTGDCILLFTRQDIVRRRRLIAAVDARADEAVAHALMATLWKCPERGESRVFDAEELADALGIEEDDLNVHLARLEQVGALRRGLDCSARGMVDVGFREPSDEEERRKFRRLFHLILKAKPNVRTQIDFQRLSDEHGINPDDLEEQLIAWSLDRLVTFSSSRRLRRVQLLMRDAPAESVRRESARWRRWEQRRLESMIDYAIARTTCRRTVVARHFGDEVADCGSRHVAPCDVCRPDPPPWAHIPDHLVPDPELLVNAELTVLQAVAWSSAYRSGKYGEASLRAAVLGQESLGDGRPLGAGVLNCPQFGAFRHLRNGQKRWDEALENLVARGMVVRRTVEGERNRRPYQTLALTAVGAQALGITLDAE